MVDHSKTGKTAIKVINHYLLRLLPGQFREETSHFPVSDQLVKESKVLPLMSNSTGDNAGMNS